jgi:hypothetical protein
MPVVVEGYDDLMRSLKNFAPALKIELENKLASVMIPLRDKAAGYAPSSFPWDLRNWNDTGQTRTRGGKFPLYDVKTVADGILYKKGVSKKNPYGFSAISYVANTSRAGSIYETAGRQNIHGRESSHQVMIDKRHSRRMVTVKSTKDSRSRNPKAAAHFVAQMNAQSKLYGEGIKRGRLIYRAWDEDKGKAQDTIIYAIQATADKFNKNYLVVGNYALKAAA